MYRCDNCDEYYDETAEGLCFFCSQLPDTDGGEILDDDQEEMLLEGFDTD